MSLENAKMAIGSVKDDIMIALSTMPSLHEIALFVIIAILIMIIVVLFHYSSIQRQVRNNSRCYKEKQTVNLAGKYIVTANNKYNDPVYRVSYDMSNRQYTAECACTPGTYNVNIPSIATYDLRTNRRFDIKDKICSCSKNVYEPGDRLYYTGYPELVRFMQNPTDTSFFLKNAY